MKTYWFTVAVGEEHERYAADLKRCAELCGVQLDVIGGRQFPNPFHDHPKALKIEGILNAPEWADRIVFLDSDIYLIDDRPFLKYNGAMRAEKRPEEWQSGAICGPVDFMRDLAETWKRNWHLSLDESSDFTRDQVSFRPTYEEVARRHGVSELPQFCNHLIRRNNLGSALPAVVHLTGSPNSGRDYVRHAVDWLKRTLFNGTWDGDLQPCDHGGNCKCSGGRWSFAEPFQRVLDLTKPRWCQHYGPGLDPLMSLANGAELVICHEGKPEYAVENAGVEMRILDESTEEYVRGMTGFDLYFVDGRRRAECLRSIRRVCRFDSVVCLHDASRRRYHEALSAWRYVRFLHKGFAVASDHPRILRLAHG